MITLRPYEATDFPCLYEWLPAFNLFHAQLLGKEEAMSEAEVSEAVKQWQESPHELYVIAQDVAPCGFVHINLIHAPVVSIEQIYVKEHLRCQGIATQAIQAIETLLQKRGELQAITMEVSPRNTHSMHLYHTLGYDNLCLLTMRKEFKENPRNKETVVLDHKFHI